MSKAKINGKIKTKIIKILVFILISVAIIVFETVRENNLDLFIFEKNGYSTTEKSNIPSDTNFSTSYDITEKCEFWGVVNNNEPYFTDSEIVDYSYESYSALDDLGRCGVAVACLGEDLMPTESRGDISAVHPTGWHSGSPANYNRCHLIGFQLAGENDNERNLITGTRIFNVSGMLPFENMVADYIKETGNHVMYRVTPEYHGNNLVANGVLMEGYSVEDEGEGIFFCVYIYNTQPGVTIDYATGEAYEVD